MKIEVFKVVNAFEALHALKRTNDMSFELSWKIEDLIENLEKHYKRYEEERLSLLKKHGEDNGNNTYKIKPEEKESFQQAINKLLNHTIEVSLEKSIELKELIDAKLTVSKDISLSSIKPFLSDKKAIEVDKEVTT